MSCDPDEIARLLAGGDERAIDRLARCYRPYLLGVGRCACRDPDGVEDAVQDALASALANLDQFRGDGSARAWVSKMVVNACRCQSRGRKRDPEWNRPLQDAAAASADPEHEAAVAELGAALAEAMSELAPEDRLLLWLVAVEGSRGPEVAEVLGITAEAARARLSRLRRRLQLRLASLRAQWSP